MSQPTIFITGGTGFIGSQVTAHSLALGYNVRLSVRKAAQIDKLKSVFSKNAAQLDFVIIPDLTQEGAYDQALQNVDYIFHIASPMPFTGDDFKTTYLAPAVQGTTGLLDAAEKVETVKRVVIVSSVVALIPMGTFVESTFHAKEGANPAITDNFDIDREWPTDPQAAGGLKYQASKLLAHRATLDWVASRKPRFHVITLHPTIVYGHSVIQDSAESVDPMNALLWASLFSEKPMMPSASVDVEDVAVAHMNALKLELDDKPEVHEFLLDGDGWSFGRVVEFVKKKYPDLGITMTGPFVEEWTVDTEKAEEVLRMKWRSLEDTISSFVDQQLQYRS